MQDCLQYFLGISSKTLRNKDSYLLVQRIDLVLYVGAVIIYKTYIELIVYHCDNGTGYSDILPSIDMKQTCHGVIFLPLTSNLHNNLKGTKSKAHINKMC